MNEQRVSQTLLRSIVLAIAGTAMSATLFASPASALPCMVDCWNENGGWGGGGGLSGGSAGTGGGTVGTGVGGGGGGGGYSDPSGTGWGVSAPPSSTFPHGNGTGNGGGGNQCTGGAEVLADHAVITGCAPATTVAPNPDAGPAVPPPPDESGDECRSRIRGDVLACQVRGEILCAAAGAGASQWGGKHGKWLGPLGGAACKVAYHYICDDLAADIDKCR